MPTPAFTFPDTLVIHVHSKDLFVILLNQFMPYARGPIDYGQTVSVDNKQFTDWWWKIQPGYYRQDLIEDLDLLRNHLSSESGVRLIFILQEYSE